MKVVIDTNVFVSGIFWEGNFCSNIIEKWKKRKFDLITSMDILDEFVRTLKSFKIRMADDMINEQRNLIIENSTIVESTTKIDIVKGDPDDDKFIEAAVAGKADIIISQDKHLLKIEEYNRIKIISPEEALLIF